MNGIALPPKRSMRIALQMTIATAALSIGGVWWWTIPSRDHHDVATLPVVRRTMHPPAISSHEVVMVAPVAPPQTVGEKIVSTRDSAILEEKTESAWQTLLGMVRIGRIPIPPPAAHEQPLDLTRRDSAALIVRYWSGRDIMAAAEWCLALPEGAMKSACLQQVALIQAAESLSSAAEWAKSLPAGSSKDSVVEALGWESSSGDPMLALDLAIDLPEGGVRARLLTHAAVVWAASDPQAAVDWARQIAVPDLSAQILEAIATAWAGSDPASAAAVVASDLPAGPEQTRASAAVIQRWAQQDPTAAAAWAQAFPAGPVGEAVTSNLVAQWAQRGADGPWQWLSSLPPSGNRDAGFAALARSLAVSNPQFAARCFAQISGNPRRF